MSAAVKLSPAGRFWSKVSERSEEGCWEWQGIVATNGYGRFWLRGRFVQAHRWSYADSGRPLLPEQVVDHLCRNRRCVRPDHLEAVSHAENVRRGLCGRMVTECVNGHPYTPENTYVKPNGCRDCRACRIERKRRYRRER